ncbi:MAG: purine-nucleoside phosphorylase [Anaerolineaceae bacterium]|nr:purine-nucleoside phosphorylase [Anaerolineaceae bacterium]
MENFITLQQIDQAADEIRKRISIKPRVGMILGSGLGDLANMISNPTIVPSGEIPFWPVSTVKGHNGQLVFGELEGAPVMVLQGRVHYYEGYSMDQVTFPIRVMLRLGVEILVVTNAAGAINPAFAPGDIMLITDQISLIAMAGLNPLRGPNLDELGERFPDMSRAYDRELIDLSHQVAAENGVKLHEGVYVCLSGPSFETPADLRFLRIIGSDAVGMSTVPEVIVAHHGGMRVVGFSGISNKANLDGSTITTHEEVLKAGEIIVPKLKIMILNILRRL